MAIDPFVQKKLDSIKRTYHELTERLADPDVVANPKQLMQVKHTIWYSIQSPHYPSINDAHGSAIVLILCYQVNQERMKIEEAVLAYQDWQRMGK